MIQLKSPADGICLSLLTDRQKQFIEDEESRKNQENQDFDYLNLRAVTGIDNTRPKAVAFTWTSDDSQGDFILEISESPAFSFPLVLVCDAPCASVYHLFIAKKYFWRVKQNTEISETYSFTIADEPPRCIFVPSLVNIRDCGGWKTETGERVRQGMIIRGSEMDIHEEISPEGIALLRNEFGIKTDLDLRIEAVKENIHTSPLGDDITHRLLPCYSYADFFEKDLGETNREIFKTFTKPENYPIYMHCWGGADRTGTVVFLLNAILGVPEESLVLDWEFTSLSVWGLRSRNASRYVALTGALSFHGKPTDSLKTKIENYLHSIGITDEDIKAMKTILLEDEKK